MSLFLVFIFLVSFVYLSWKDTRWGIFILVFLLPSYLWRISFFGWPSTFLELMIFSLFIIWLCKDKLYKKINFSLSKKNKNELTKNWRILLLLWLLISFIALLTNFSFSAVGIWRAYWLEPVMVFLILIYNIKNKKDLDFILKAFAFLMAGLFLLSIWQYFSEWNLAAAYRYPNPKRLTAIYSYPNALALLTAPIASFFAIWWLESKNKIKNLWKLIIFILGISLSILAVSQGAISAIGLSLFFYLILAKKIRKLGIPLVSIVLLLASIFTPLNNYWKDFQQQLFDPQLNLKATSLEIRSNQWQETTWMLKDNFVFGAGINGYQKAMGPYRQYDWIETYLYPHNIFLNFWTEIGLFGLILFLVIIFAIIQILKNLFIDKNTFAWPLSVMWLTWFVHGLVDVPYFKNDLSILFFIMIAMTLLAYKFQNNAKKI